MSLLIAWCLLSIPFAVVVGMCIRRGLSPVPLRGAGDIGTLAAQPWTAGTALGLPAQRLAPAGESVLQDAS